MQTRLLSRKYSPLAAFLVLAGCAVGTETEGDGKGTAAGPTGFGEGPDTDGAAGGAAQRPGIPSTSTAQRLDLQFEGVEGRTLHATVTNLTDETVDVRLVASMRADSIGLIELGNIELGPGQGEAISIDDADYGFSDVLAIGQTAGLSIGAVATFAGGELKRESFRVYIDDAFVVKTPEEVNDIKRRPAKDEEAVRSPFRFAAQKVVSVPEAKAGSLAMGTPFLPRPELEAQLEGQPSVQSGLQQAAGGVRAAVGKGAATVTTRFCVFGNADWSDPNIGDWLTSNQYWTAQGMSYYVWDDDEDLVGVGYLGVDDGAPNGCTRSYSVDANATYRLEVFSFAAPPNGAGDWSSMDVWPTASESALVNVGTAAQHNAFLDINNPSVRVAFAASTAMYMLPDGVDQDFDVHVGKPATTYTGGEVHISSGHTDEKFIIARTLGYAVLANHMPTFWGSGLLDYSVTGSGSCVSGASNAGYGSEEHMSVAFVEGFASFYGAAAFNDKSQPDCAYWHGATMDCEYHSASHPLAKQRTVCGGRSGRGVQWDWTRQFWDVYQATDFASVMGFLGAADSSAHTKKNTYVRLDWAANWSNVNSVWDAGKSSNGVKVCADGIGNGSHSVCCASSCGTCGGSGCGSRPGGAAACCVGHIEDANQPCTGTNAPCVLH